VVQSSLQRRSTKDESMAWEIKQLQMDYCSHTVVVSLSKAGGLLTPADHAAVSISFGVTDFPEQSGLSTEKNLNDRAKQLLQEALQSL
jgi:hypothetical protein